MQLNYTDDICWLHYFIIQLHDAKFIYCFWNWFIDIGDKLGENTCDIGGMVLKNVWISYIIFFQNNTMLMKMEIIILVQINQIRKKNEMKMIKVENENWFEWCKGE